MMKCVRCGIVTIVIGVLAIALGIILGLVVFPKVVDQQIDEQVKLVNGSKALERWETLPEIDLKVYFFHVVNPADVQKGSRPILQEKGPYIYKEKIWRHDISEYEDTLTYNQTALLEFDKERSHPLTEDDEITVANLPLMSVLTMTEKKMPNSLPMVNLRIGALFDNPTDLFLRTTPKKFLFEGIRIHCDTKNIVQLGVCAKIKQYSPKRYISKDGKDLLFSALSSRNNTVDGPYSIDSGAKDVSSLGKILSWKDSPTLGTWVINSTCDAFHGTDTTIYAPHPTHKTLVEVFQYDVCRSVNLAYEKEIEYKGVTGYRYVMENDTYDSPSSKPENFCFCKNETSGIVGEDGCLLDGAVELISCTEAPIVLTSPHFYQADKTYQDGVIGLTPDKEAHQVFTDLETHTGYPLRGAKRGQFNIFYKKFNKIDLTQNLKTTLMPIIWISEGIELNDAYIKIMNDELLNALFVLDLLYWLVIGIGIIIALAASLCTFMTYKKCCCC